MHQGLQKMDVPGSVGSCNRTSHGKKIRSAVEGLAGKVIFMLFSTCTTFKVVLKSNVFVYALKNFPYLLLPLFLQDTQGAAGAIGSCYSLLNTMKGGVAKPHSVYLWVHATCLRSPPTWVPPWHSTLSGLSEKRRSGQHWQGDCTKRVSLHRADKYNVYYFYTKNNTLISL